MSAGPINSPPKQGGTIFVVSVLILYLELVLIRWIGTEVRLFAFLGNLILVVCFFGVGLGCYWGRKPAPLMWLGLSLLALVVIVANPLRVGALDLRHLAEALSGFEDSPVYADLLLHRPTTLEMLGALAVLGGLVFLVAVTFLPLGQLLGQTLADHPQTVLAYSINVAGSLAGVWLFNAMSQASLEPPVWFALAAILVAALVWIRRDNRWQSVGLVAASAVVVWLGQEPALRRVWSPYHRLSLMPWYADGERGQVQQGYLIEVNGTFYQHMLNLSDEFVRAHPDLLPPELVKRGHYNLPFCFKPNARRMLIVGAGSGNDAAAALRHGVEQVDCVEIDPRIYELGRELHPEQPYQSPRVRVTVDDARAFFKHASGRYDVIWFGWLDSHTLGSSYNNLRLDHYVYTRESLEEAKQLLADDGIIILGFGAERKWIGDRLAGLLRDVFGREPLGYLESGIPPQCGGGGNVLLVCGRKRLSLEDIPDPEARSIIKARQLRFAHDIRPTTDDWPYLYLQRAKIPSLYLLVSAAIIVSVVLARRRLLKADQSIEPHFFALGAAFLLLEVQTVSRATLLFGMTWVVNAIVISAVLVMILLSNLVAARWPRFPYRWIVVGLATTVTALALVPLDWFNTLTGATKLIAASAFLTAPVFFAGLVFIRSFAACSDKSSALGSNLFGALVGGLLESLSFLTGIRALVLLVGIFYALALWLRPKVRIQARPQ